MIFVLYFRGFRFFRGPLIVGATVAESNAEKNGKKMWGKKFSGSDVRKCFSQIFLCKTA